LETNGSSPSSAPPLKPLKHMNIDIDIDIVGAERRGVAWRGRDIDGLRRRGGGGGADVTLIRRRGRGRNPHQETEGARTLRVMSNKETEGEGAAATGRPGGAGGGRREAQGGKIN
jgi:hypothetical protein